MLSAIIGGHIRTLALIMKTYNDEATQPLRGLSSVRPPINKALLFLFSFVTKIEGHSIFVLQSIKCMFTYVVLDFYCEL